MRPLTLRASLLALVVSASAATAVPATAPKAKPTPDVLVAGDAAEKPAPEYLPAPGKPVYYLFLGAGERALGSAWAGEPPPDKQVLQSGIFRVLASQGYVHTQEGGPMPQLAIVVTWGSVHLMTDDVETIDREGKLVTKTIHWNTREISALVGADKASDKPLNFVEADQIHDAARQDRLYVMVAALDARALLQNQKKLIWRTRMSIESRRASLPESPTVMLNSAAPYLGKNTDLPIFVDDNLRKKAEIKVGTPIAVPSKVSDGSPRNKTDPQTPHIYSNAGERFIATPQETHF